MKFLKYISIFAAASLLFSCYEDAKVTAMPAEAVVAPVMNEMSDILIAEDNLQSEISFSWSSVDYGYPAEVTYSLYANYQDVDYQIGQSFSPSYTMTKENLNNYLVDSKGMAVPEGETSTIFFYVVSNISAGNDAYAKRSNAIQIDITTIKSTAAPWIRRPLYMPGNYQGWSPADAPVLWETGENSNEYQGLVQFTCPADATTVMFKFTPAPNWENDFGGALDALVPKGSDIAIEPGLYWLTVSLNEAGDGGKVSAKKVGAINVIGSAVGGWDVANDLPLEIGSEFADINAQTWSAVCDNCVGGEFKFRLTGGDFADPWAMNWGGTLEHLVQGGGNLTAPSGKVRFSINFRGDIPALAEDATNPSPISATVEQVE